MSAPGDSSEKTPGLHEAAPRRPSIRDSHKQATYQLLLEASEELFIEQGYADTTIGQIAERAGASRATFYLHFDAKWRAVAEVCEQRLIAGAFEHYSRLNALVEPTRADIRTWLSGGLDFYVANEALILLQAQAARLEPDYATEAFTALRSVVDVMANRLGAWGPDRAAEAHLRLSLLIIQFASFAAEWRAGMWDVDRATVLDVLTDLWVGGLGLADDAPGGDAPS